MVIHSKDAHCWKWLRRAYAKLIESGPGTVCHTAVNSKQVPQPKHPGVNRFNKLLPKYFIIITKSIN